jgi:hypothetical protein
MIINTWNENGYTIQQANYNSAIMLQTWTEQISHIRLHKIGDYAQRFRIHTANILLQL